MLPSNAFDVFARVQVLSAAEGGPTSPFTGPFRPNHNFGGPENTNFYIGQLEIAPGDWVKPGETRDLWIRFLDAPRLKDLLIEGATWRIQAARKLIAIAEVLPQPARNPLPPSALHSAA